MAATGDHVRAIVAGLRETEERETWGHSTFRVRDKMFAGMDNDGHALTLKASKTEQRALLSGRPEVLFVPKYVGVRGWVGIRLNGIDGDELQELVTEAWRMSAPKRMVASFDDSQ